MAKIREEIFAKNKSADKIVLKLKFFFWKDYDTRLIENVVAKESAQLVRMLGFF